MHKISITQWTKLPTSVQIANIGSEAERAIGWKKKRQYEYVKKSFDRTMQMLYLTIDDRKNTGNLRELTRMREILVDFLIGNNSYRTPTDFWGEYFGHFYLVARKRV